MTRFERAVLAAGIMAAGLVGAAGAARAEQSAPPPVELGEAAPATALASAPDLAQRPRLVLAREGFGPAGAAPVVRAPDRNWTGGGASSWGRKPRDGGVYVHGQKLRYLARF